MYFFVIVGKNEVVVIRGKLLLSLWNWDYVYFFIIVFIGRVLLVEGVFSVMNKWYYGERIWLFLKFVYI